jgi:hypothetical protein
MPDSGHMVALIAGGTNGIGLSTTMGPCQCHAQRIRQSPLSRYGKLARVCQVSGVMVRSRLPFPAARRQAAGAVQDHQRLPLGCHILEGRTWEQSRFRS